MQKTKPIEIISCFSADEMKEFSAFVRSPYFNTNKNLVKLFDIIKKELKKIVDGKLSEEDIFKLLFPGKQFNYGIMKNLISALAAVCEEFGTIHPLRTKPINQFRNKLVLADYYDNLRLDQHYDKVMRKIDFDFETMPIDNFHYANRSMAEEQKYFFFASRSDDRALENAIYNEMIYNLCNIYRMLSRNMWKIYINTDNVNSKFEKDFITLLNKHIRFQELADDMKGIDEKDYNYIQMNALLVKLLFSEEDTAPYYQLKKIVIDKIDNYENYERYSIFTKLISYCSTAYQVGHKDFIRESVEVRRLVMEKVKFNHQGLGPFSFHYFTETIMMYLQLGDINGAENFLSMFGDSVGEVNKEINYNLSMAYILEKKGLYERALGYLAKSWHSDTEINLRVRRLYFILYYNMNEFEAGLDAVNAFRSYIKGNDDIKDFFKERYITAAYYTEKVFKIRAMPEKFTRDDVKKLKDEHLKKNRILSQWLNEKFEELGKIAG